MELGRFWTIIGWILLKKIWTNLNKHLLQNQYNAVTNVAIYSIDCLLFVGYRPFRDNFVNFSQGLAAFSNLVAILLAALPHILPNGTLPGFFSGEVVMWVTTAGTGVLTVVAALDPTWAAMGFAVQLGTQATSVCGICKVGGAGGATFATTLTALWVRVQKIFLARWVDQAFANERDRACELCTNCLHGHDRL